MHPRWRRMSLGVGAAIVLAPVVAAGADLDGGKTLYGKWCQSCHGADGKGNPAMAQAFKAKALNLGAVDLSTLSASEREAREQAQAFHTIIAEGKADGGIRQETLGGGAGERARVYRATFMKRGE